MCFCNDHYAITHLYIKFERLTHSSRKCTFSTKYWQFFLIIFKRILWVPSKCVSWRNKKKYLSQHMTKPTKWHVRPAIKSDQPEHLPSLIRVFAVRMKKAWLLKFPLSVQRRLIRLDGCPGRSSLGAHAILFVLSCAGSFLIASYLDLCKRWEMGEDFEY